MRQDGQVTLQPASRDPQEQLLLVRARQLLVEEAEQDRLAQPRLKLSKRPGRSRNRPGSCACWEQREFAAATAAAAGAQEAAGRSAEQIHQPDPGLAEQVRKEGKESLGEDGGPKGFMLLFGPSTLHF